MSIEPPVEPSDLTHLRVRFPFADDVLEGVVRTATVVGTVKGNAVRLHVDVDGKLYRTTLDEAELMPDRH